MQLGSGDSGVDQHLSFFNQPVEVLVADEALGVDLVDVFGARWARSEPSVFGHDLQAANRLMIAGGMAQNLRDGFTRQGSRLDLIR